MAAVFWDRPRSERAPLAPARVDDRQFRVASYSKELRLHPDREVVAYSLDQCVCRVAEELRCGARKVVVFEERRT